MARSFRGHARAIPPGNEEIARHTSRPREAPLALPAAEAKPAGERPAPNTRRLVLDDGTVLEAGWANPPLPNGGESRGGGGVYVPAVRGRHGVLFLLIEGAPSGTAAFLHAAVQRALDRDQGTANARLLRAVRQACAQLEAQTLHRYELTSLGLSALFVEEGIAYFTQLPPCQAYVLDGAVIRALPEEPMRGAAKIGSVAGRRWEVELDLCRIILRPGMTLVLCSAALAPGVTKNHLGTYGSRPASQVAATLAGERSRRDRPAIHHVLVVTTPLAAPLKARSLSIISESPTRLGRRTPEGPRDFVPEVRRAPIEAWGLRRRERTRLPLFSAVGGRLQEPPDFVARKRARRWAGVLKMLVLLLVVAGALVWARAGGSGIPEPDIPVTDAEPAAGPAALTGRTLLGEESSAEGFRAFAFAAGAMYVLATNGLVSTYTISTGDITHALLAGLPGRPVISMAGREAALLLLESGGTIWLLDTGTAASGDGMRAVPAQVRGASAWQQPVAIGAYAGNLYVLDAGTANSPGQIWRHGSATDSGYDGEGQAWLQATSGISLQGATAMAIDGFIWVVKVDGTILKMSGGRLEPFTVSGLDLPIAAAGAIYTERDYRSVYVVDTSGRRLVQLGKDGRVESQVLEIFPSGEQPRGLWVDEPGRRAFVITDRRVQEFRL
jgi:hypothetical protein